MDPDESKISGSERYPRHTLEIFPDFIWIKFSDEINGNSARRAIDLILELSAIHNVYRFVSDSRGCTLNYPVLERYEVGKYWVEKVKPKIFSVSIVDEAHWSGLVENVATNRGGSNLFITPDEAKAIEWIRSH